MGLRNVSIFCAFFTVMTFSYGLDLYDINKVRKMKYVNVKLPNSQQHVFFSDDKKYLLFDYKNDSSIDKYLEVNLRTGKIRDLKNEFKKRALEDRLIRRK